MFCRVLASALLVLIASQAVAAYRSGYARGLKAKDPFPSQDCESPCSCSYTVEFGDDTCSYANTTLDVRDFTVALAQKEPDFAAARAIFDSGKNAVTNPATQAKRAMRLVTQRNYGQESYYKLASIYFNATGCVNSAATNNLGENKCYLDILWGQAVRGDGAYANNAKCCGVRAEVAKAGARLFSGIFALHEANAGLCLATGCNGTRNISLTVAASELKDQLVVLAGGDSDAVPPQKPKTAANVAGTTNPYNLFQATQAVGKFFCTGKVNRKNPLRPINKDTLDAGVAAADAARNNQLAEMQAQYDTIEKAFVARFLQYSLREFYDASRKATKGLLRKAGTCREPCLREAQQAAAKLYFQAAEPIIARNPANAQLVVQANALLSAGNDPFKKHGELVTVYTSIVNSLGLDPKLYLAKCKLK